MSKTEHEILRFCEPLQGICLQTPASLSRSQIRARELQEHFEAGLKQGRAAAEQELNALRIEMRQIQTGALAQLKQLLPDIRQDCESVLIALALEVARKLADGAAITEEMVVGCVRQALTQIEEAGLTVLLHPDDLALLQSVNSSILLDTVAGERLQFQASNDVSRGGCVIEAPSGLLDARRETRFQRIKEIVSAT